MGNTTKIDLNKFDNFSDEYVQHVMKHLWSAEGYIENTVIPIEPNLETNVIDTRGFQNLLTNLIYTATDLREEIMLIYNNFSKAEKNILNLKITDFQFSDEDKFGTEYGVRKQFKRER